MTGRKMGAVLATASALVVLLAASTLVSAQETPTPGATATPATGTPGATPTARPVGQDPVQDLLDEMGAFSDQLGGLMGGGILGIGGRDAYPSDLTAAVAQGETLLFGFQELAPRMQPDQREDALVTLDESMDRMADVFQNYVDERAAAAPGATPGAVATPGATATPGAAMGTPGAAGTPQATPTVTTQQIRQWIQQARNAQPTAQGLTAAGGQLKQATAAMRQQAGQLSVNELQSLLGEFVETLDQLEQPVEQFARQAYRTAGATPGVAPGATPTPVIPSILPTPGS